MRVDLRKQPEKYLKSLDEPTLKRLRKALGKLENLEGDIQKLRGKDNAYRLKIHHYRILFHLDISNQIITVTEINTRTNIKY